MRKKESNTFTTDNSLSQYFYDQFCKINQRIDTPVKKEYLFYASEVMQRYLFAYNLFEEVDGRVQDKILGVKLLESEKYSNKKKKQELREIGDMCLFLCGFFAPSLNRRILQIKYYEDLGRLAYMRLNGSMLTFLNIKNFYTELSNSFGLITSVMSLCADDYFKSEKNCTENLMLISTKKLKAS